MKKLGRRTLLIILGLGLFFSSIGLMCLDVNDFGMSVSLDFGEGNFLARAVGKDFGVMTWSYDNYFVYTYSYRWGEGIYNFFSTYYYIIQPILVSLSICALRFAYDEECSNHGTSIVEARTALPLDEGVKCRQPERVEDGGYRSVPTPRWPTISCLDANRAFGGRSGMLWGNGPNKGK